MMKSVAERKTTEAQERVLKALKDFKRANGYTPSIRELGIVEGTTPNAVKFKMESLVRRGRVVKMANGRYDTPPVDMVEVKEIVNQLHRRIVCLDDNGMALAPRELSIKNLMRLRELLDDC